MMASYRRTEWMNLSYRTWWAGPLRLRIGRDVDDGYRWVTLRWRERVLIFGFGWKHLRDNEWMVKAQWWKSASRDRI